MLTTLFLSAVLSQAPALPPSGATSVLVMKDGTTLTVRKLQIGDLYVAVLVNKADVDLARSGVKRPKAAASSTERIVIGPNRATSSSKLAEPVRSVPDVSVTYEREKPDTAAWTARFDAIRAEYRRVQGIHTNAVKRHDELVKEYNRSLREPGYRHGHAERDISRQQMAELRTRVDDLELELKAIKAEYADLKEQARRAGVLPVAYRRGL